MRRKKIMIIVNIGLETPIKAIYNRYIIHEIGLIISDMICVLY